MTMHRRASGLLLTLVFGTCPCTLSLAQKAQPLPTEQRQTFDQGLLKLQESLKT